MCVCVQEKEREREKEAPGKNAQCYGRRTEAPGGRASVEELYIIIKVVVFLFLFV